MLFSLFENVLDTYTPQPRQIVLAFSGGVDSRVMLDLLATYRDIHPQHRYLVIHVHHGLSPNADEWMVRCEAWATEADFAFKGIRVALNKQEGNLEKAAREARYQAILNHVENDALVLTGQHADDQAETFLLALKRGSGPAGLAAMPETRPLGHAVLCRPLLSITRAVIEHYAEDQGLSWLEDESNLDCRFDRNFIRQQWLPLAQERWPGLVKAINRTAHHCAEQEALLDELLSGYDHRVMLADGGLSLDALMTFSSSMQTAMMRRWLKKTAGVVPSSVQMRELQVSVIDAAQDANPSLLLGSVEVRRYQGRLYVVPPHRDVSAWTGELELGETLGLPDGLGSIVVKPAELGGMIRAPLEGEVVRISFNPEGISAHPAGRQGKRKLKKLFQEYGVPSWERRRTPILFYGEKVAAVAGLFVCEGFVGGECELVWHKCHTFDA